MRSHSGFPPVPAAGEPGRLECAGCQTSRGPGLREGSDDHPDSAAATDPASGIPSDGTLVAGTLDLWTQCPVACRGVLGSLLGRALLDTLTTPVVLWGGAPFFVRGWRSVVNRGLNMVTLARWRICSVSRSAVPCKHDEENTDPGCGEGLR